MGDPIDVGTAREDHGLMTFIQYPDIAESERQIAIAACSRSSIEAVVTTGVPGLVTVDHGAP